MIAPISSSRRDGQSSFTKLSVYLLHGRRHCEAFRGDFVLSDNILSVETVDIEMAAVARENVRAKDPLFHYQLAWKPGERPTKEQWDAAAKKSIRDLEFEGHQYLIEAHDDKEHFHVHVMINRIHPETYRASYPKFSMRTLDKCCREIEHEQGWEESPGLYRWSPEQGAAVRNTPEEMERHRHEAKSISVHGPASKIEAHRDVNSLHAYARNGGARDLKALLDRDRCSWREAHALLQSYGLEIEKSERGGYTVHALGTELRVKASDVFRSAFSGKANRARTEQKLGAWEPRAQTADPAHPKYSPHERDPKRRDEQRAQREQDRRQLRSEYRTYGINQRLELRTFDAAVRNQRKEIAARLKAQRTEIRSSAMSSAEKKSAISVAVARSVAERRVLAASALQQRASMRTLEYPDWVALVAESGDKRAAAQLRGWKYRDKKRSKSAFDYAASEPGVIHFSGASAAEHDWSRLTNDRLKQELQRSEELAKTLAQVRWKLNKRSGDVMYLIAGRESIVDRGRVLSVLDSDEATIVLGLEMAVRKFGQTITAEGSVAWKQKVANVAARNNVFVQFADPTMQRTFETERRKGALREQRLSALESVSAAVRQSGDNEIPLKRFQVDALTDAVFGRGRGSGYVDDLQKDLQPGERKKGTVRGLFELLVSRSNQGAFSYTASVLPGKCEELETILKAALDRLSDIESIKMRTKSDRDRSLEREKSRGLVVTRTGAARETEKDGQGR